MMRAARRVELFALLPTLLVFVKDIERGLRFALNDRPVPLPRRDHDGHAAPLHRFTLERTSLERALLPQVATLQTHRRPAGSCPAPAARPDRRAAPPRLPPNSAAPGRARWRGLAPVFFASAILVLHRLIRLRRSSRTESTPLGTRSIELDTSTLPRSREQGSEVRQCQIRPDQQSSCFDRATSTPSTSRPASGVSSHRRRVSSTGDREMMAPQVSSPGCLRYRFLIASATQ